MALKQKNPSFPKKDSRVDWALDLKTLIASFCISVSIELHGHSAQPSFRLASTTPASVNKLIACLEVKQKGNGPGNLSNMVLNEHFKWQRPQESYSYHCWKTIPS